eukprot:TRINITY_DN12092_c0_g2_i1.p1 TRINITY_DN12092_c0_g2~~TRINITY_DN12092_c0_g2_i1.p1  ORF type:complete len:1857 (+),score=275.76 TRINITY_DN12092_c0_g2_i1:143-5713(+)
MLALFFLCIVAATGYAIAAAPNGDQQSTEQYVRRACKFRPLPQDLSEGFQRPGGRFQMSDVYSVPAVALARGGHTITAVVDAGSALGISVQVPFAVTALVRVDVVASDGQTYKCEHTWGAGGRMKQCSLSRVPLLGGLVTLRFVATGVSDSGAVEGLGNPSACISLRVDLEIAPLPLVQRSAVCPEGAAGAFSPQAAVFNGKQLGPAPFAAAAPLMSNGVVWSTVVSTIPKNEGQIPDRNAEPQMALVSAKVTYPTAVRPVHMLFEETSPADVSRSSLAKPECRYHCIGGTAITNGQSLRLALAYGKAYILWLLAPDPGPGQCVKYEFELKVDMFPISRLQNYYLGPPPWMCEGSAWPRRLEQVDQNAGAPAAVKGEGEFKAATLRSWRFVLDDTFDLTRPPLSRCSDGECLAGQHSGFHGIEIVVTEPSVLRLTMRTATVSARPMLLDKSNAPISLEAMLGSFSVVDQAEVPSAGGEVSHAVHSTLRVGKYYLQFVTEFPVGGLRSCASFRLRLELDPIAGLPRPMATRSVAGSCSSESNIADLFARQVARVQTPLASFAESTSGGQAQTFTATFPRPLGSAAPSTQRNERDIMILARAPLTFSGGDASTRLVRAAVTSPFLEADLRLQIYADGVALGEPQAAPDGDGYEVVVGPLDSQSKYEAVLFHVPRDKGAIRTATATCVTFTVDISSIALGKPQAKLLPGAMTCLASAPSLPTTVKAAPNDPVLLEGDFLLPSSGGHTIQVAFQGDRTSGPVVLRAVATSTDAEVALHREGGETATISGLSQDQLFLTEFDQVSIRLTTSRLPTPSVCPTLRLHLVLWQLTSALGCSAASSFAAAGGPLEAKLRAAITAQPVDAAALRVFSGAVPAAGVDLKVSVVVESAMAELRLEIGLEPPWLPWEVWLEDAFRPGKVWAKASYVGHRLVLLAPSIPNGSYRLRIKSAPDVPVDGLMSECAQATFSVALLRPSGRDTSNYRQEMLNSPELLAVLPMPAALVPSWLGPEDPAYVASQMYALPSMGASTSITVAEPSLVRLLAEPADILNPQLTMEVRRGVMVVQQPTPMIGSISLFLDQPGRYDVIFKPGLVSCDGCVHQELPFFFTIGIEGAQASSARRMTESGCDGSMPHINMFGGLEAHSWRRVEHARVGRVSTTQIPLLLVRPAVVLVAVWSNFIDRFVRIGLKAEEGLWVGEQRMRLSALEIELPPGKYQIQIDEPSPANPSLSSACADFGVLVSAVAFTPPPVKAAPESAASHLLLGLGFSMSGGSSAGNPGWAVGLGARCEGLGASPLPLDFFSAAGGSGSLGGPTDERGRLLVRQKILLTDIHDGRKKVYFRNTGPSFIRIAVTSADATSVEAVLEDAKHSQQVMDRVWTHGNGWSMAKRLGYSAMPGWWISFHREHRDGMVSGCAAFQLMVQMAPISDIDAVAACRGSEVDPARWVQQSLAGNSDLQSVSPGNANGAFEQTFQVTLTERSLVEVEVQFNFLVSTVDLHMRAAPAHRQMYPEFGGVGGPQSPVNAHVVLQLRLPAGNHAFSLSHESTSWQPGASNGVTTRHCFPLRLLVRHASWAEGSQPATVAVGPACSAPLSQGSDLVVSASASSQVAPLPKLAGFDATGMAQYASSTIAVWDRDAIKDAIATGGRQIPGSPGVYALPLHFSDTATQRAVDVLVNTQGGAGWMDGTAVKPWAGETWPRSAADLPPDRWLIENPSQQDASVAVAAVQGPQPLATMPPQVFATVSAPPRPVINSYVQSPPALRPPTAAYPSSHGSTEGSTSSFWFLCFLIVGIGAAHHRFGILNNVRLPPWLQSYVARYLPKRNEDMRGEELHSMVEVVGWPQHSRGFEAAPSGPGSYGSL